MTLGQERHRLVIPIAFGAALAVAALAWWGRMRHPSYIRQVMLTGLLAPAALTVALLAVGPSVAGIANALKGAPAKLFFWAVWAHAALAWFSLAWTSNSGATVDRAVVLTTLAVWGTGWLIASRGERWKYMVAALLAVVGFEAFVGAGSHMAQLSLGSAPARLSAPIGNANTVAVLMFFPIVGGLAVLSNSLRDRSSWPWPGLGGAALVALGALTFFFAWSRSGFVGLAAAVVVLAALVALRGCSALGISRNWALVPIGVALLGLSVGGVVLAGNREARAAMSYRLRSGSLAARYYGSMASWEIFKDNPLCGAGAGTFLSEAPRRILPERYAGSYGNTFLNVAHNEYAESGAELGVAGLLAFLAVLGGALLGAWRGARRKDDSLRAALSGGLCAAIAGVAVSSLADPSFRYWDFTGVFYAAAALAAGAPWRAGSGEETQAEARGRTVPLQLLTVLGGVLAAGLSGIWWAGPDMIREISWLEAHVAARSQDHVKATGKYRVAVRAHGYFLSRVLAHYDWVHERAACGRTEEALELAEELDAALPECPLILRYLSDARLKLKDRAGALCALVRAGRRDPYARTFPQDFFRVFGKDLKGNARAVEGVVARLKLSKADAAVLASLGDASRQAWQDAESRLAGLDPDSVTFVHLEFWRGLLLSAAGRPGEAAKAFDAHVARRPRHAHAYRQLARARAAVAGRAGSAGEIEALELCLRHDIEHEEARLSLVKALVGAKRYEDALAVVLPYLPIARRKVSFYIEAARVRQLQGNYSEAARLLRVGLLQTKSPRIRKLLESMSSPENGG